MIRQSAALRVSTLLRNASSQGGERRAEMISIVIRTLCRRPRSFFSSTFLTNGTQDREQAESRLRAGRFALPGLSLPARSPMNLAGSLYFFSLRLSELFWLNYFADLLCSAARLSISSKCVSNILYLFFIRI